MLPSTGFSFRDPRQILSSEHAETFPAVSWQRGCSVRCLRGTFDSIDEGQLWSMGTGEMWPRASDTKANEADNPGARSDHGSGTGACMPRPDLIDHLGSRDVVGNSCAESDTYLKWLNQLMQGDGNGII
ncbi:uncharacterized protein PGTG_03829 [Puccinia graminis f. sp. tritici CRL 75-36-700-3]|uniref:Uncharacterized protein n=1 Tax=Puccinia graminis f. sp. tritici (strain CRL 75-36-700-3 / race SCCL) TaxID=418459 RepID=E3K0P8_PUCGT|nr:uncharacterized protein PGTG_03829 [Puccinia graminis f. sp. tritici CRL 75-36-700-3]EFP77873.1 hypothetical protein PGTG_03829 [Puccinia graminis f. sp. tritici CRL 75-36-700-3]